MQQSHFTSTNSADAYFENHGEISAGDEVFFFSGGVSGDTATILNTGLISGTNHVIEVDRAATVINSGTISSLTEDDLILRSQPGLCRGGKPAISRAT